MKKLGRKLINKYGVNSVMGAVGQMLAGEQDSTRVVSSKTVRYLADRTPKHIRYS